MDLIPKESKKNFEYQLLNDNTRTIVWQRTSEIKNLMRLTADNIISIGQKLTEVKEQLEHGTFQSWLRTEFEWSEQTARQFMQVYRWSKTFKNKNFVFSQLGTSALYLLAAPSTPPEARKEVLDLVEVGEKVTYTRTKTIVDRYKNPVTIDEAEGIVDVTVDRVEEVKVKPNVRLKDTVKKAIAKQASTSEQLFRLQTEAIGCIVRLYRADELESTTELNIGTTVTIKIGRWLGRTAKIIEVLTDIQPSTTNSQKKQMLAPSIEIAEGDRPQVANLTEKRLNHNTSLCIIDLTDFSARQTIKELDESLIISYGKLNLAITGQVEKLKAFTEQIQTNAAFVEDVFERALNEAAKNT
jgi:hypothetical protein